MRRSGALSHRDHMQLTEDLRHTFTSLDLGEIVAVIVDDLDVADWARRRGYRVEIVERVELALYRIEPGVRPCDTTAT